MTDVSRHCATIERFAALDLLRGVAALAIVTRHFPWADGQPIMLQRDYLGVDLFFVLSGFVIAHAYGPALARGLRPDAFLVRRLVRLYPLYLLATLAAALLWLGRMLGGAGPGLGEWAGALALNLAFLPVAPQGGMLPQSPYPFVGPAWSLLWELAANLVLALAYPHLARNLPRLIAAGIVLLAFTALAFGSLDAGSSWRDLSGGACRVVYSFFAGVALFSLRTRLRWRLKVPDWVLGSALLVLFLPPMTVAFGAAYDVAVVLFAFPLIVILAADAATTPVSRAVGGWLGYCSYGVYVLHGPVLLAMEWLSPPLTGRALVAHGHAGVALLVAISLVAAHAATRWIDTPARGWVRRRLAARARIPATAIA